MKNIAIDDYVGMSMAEFLLNYANLDDDLSTEQVLDMETAKLTHQDLTKLGLPYIKRVPVEIVTENDISSGKILIVYDFKSTKSNKRCAPYLRPAYVKQLEEEQLAYMHQDCDDDSRQSNEKQTLISKKEKIRKRELK
ncbi:MAG: hypothetical protein J1F35_04765 [Erysipelotrichales bacterium]|nr:hypothetical protein [Erysipelotrichales bacterium]